MIDFIKPDEWCIIEEGFDPKRHEQCEALFALGNGKMGGRANFEERYSGKTLQGNYVAGVYYPDKTRVGWWKNGYPEYFAKVLNAADWAGIRVWIDSEEVDLHHVDVSDFKRTLNMHEGVLYRTFKAHLSNNKEIEVSVTRFLSIVDDECGAMEYTVKLLNFSGKIKVESHIDFDVVNNDSNYDEKYWKEVEKDVAPNQVYITAATKKLDFHVCSGMRWQVYVDQEKIAPDATTGERDKYASTMFNVDVAEGQTFRFVKFATNVSSENYPKNQLITWARENLSKIRNKGYERLLQEQKEAWAAKWAESDIIVEGDVKAQQAIRFNIFQLNQTYTGEDERLNIGPKGFTGEKYGGSTYWDTEAYCLPFYLSTADKHVAKQLLVYRYKQLDKAIENAEKLGFTGGAALYPMVTMNGEECHNEWEITFEEIHRNGAIAYAIHKYVSYTGDEKHLAEYGLEVLIGIARFWSQRITFSNKRGKYVMLGVTGPNEYENNIDNNFYTNYISNWCLKYTKEVAQKVAQSDADAYRKICEKTGFDLKETERWDDIVANMHFPYDEELGIYLQQENFLDKEIIPAAQLPQEQRPINQHWSWDRILRSCYIKQADTLQGFYFFESDFTDEALAKHFDFYEPITVHESSLSPCVHAVQAAKLGRTEKAYEMYIRTARLDLDDYNSEVHEGLHITSMAGTWMAFVEGFGGMRVRDNQLHFNPTLPEHWKGYAFSIRFRDNVIRLHIDQAGVEMTNLSGEAITVSVRGEHHTLPKEDKVFIKA
jgi:maltose phosphorylase